MNINISITDRSALLRACQRLNIKVEEGTFKFYSSTEEGLGIFLDGWKYPAVLKKDGSISYDIYKGNWGDISKLNELKTYYGLEKAKAEARKKGYLTYEIKNPQNQELELRIRIGG
jgi:gamma-glutamylcyclotransferase (GGCT)/AIG2-like uncharacterized protein YtfP